jgi:hypothetical protein
VAETLKESAEHCMRVWLGGLPGNYEVPSGSIEGVESNFEGRCKRLISFKHEGGILFTIEVTGPVPLLAAWFAAPPPLGEYLTSEIETALTESLRLIHIYSDLLRIEIEAAKFAGIFMADREAMKAVLGNSVALQSALAGLVNSLDGGARMQFTPEQWLQRLRMMTQSDARV